MDFSEKWFEEKAIRRKRRAIERLDRQINAEKGRRAERERLEARIGKEAAEEIERKKMRTKRFLSDMLGEVFLIVFVVVCAVIGFGWGIYSWSARGSDCPPVNFIIHVITYTVGIGLVGGVVTFLLWQVWGFANDAKGDALGSVLGFAFLWGFAAFLLAFIGTCCVDIATDLNISFLGSVYFAVFVAFFGAVREMYVIGTENAAQRLRAERLQAKEESSED